MNRAIFWISLRLLLRTPGISVVMLMGLLALLPPLLHAFLPELPWRPISLMLLVAFCAIAVPMLAQALLAQNHPHSAHLLPGQTGRLRIALLGLWVLGGAVAPLAVVALSPTLHSIDALARGLLMGLTVAAVLITMMRSSVFVWAPLMLLTLPALMVLAQAPELVLVGIVLLGVPMAALGLSRLVRSGNAAHLRFQAKRSQVKLATQGLLRGDDLLATSSGPDWLRRLGSSVSRWHARRLLARPTPANTLSRLALLVLGRGHWSMAVPFTLFLGLLITPTQTIGQGSALAWPLSLTQSFVGWALVPWLLLMPLAINRAGQRGTVREQAVLALLPGPPARRELALAWAAHQTRSFLCVAAPLVGAQLLLFALAGESLGKPLLFGGVVLMMSLSHWTDLSRPAAGVWGGSQLLWLLPCLGLAWLAWSHGPLAAAMPLWVAYPLLLTWRVGQARSWRAPFPLERISPTAATR